MINKFLYPNGGSETYIFNLGEYLCHKGHKVEYFGMEDSRQIVGNRMNSYTKNMDFHKGNKLLKLWYPIKTIYSGEARKKIRKVLEDFQPDVCHLNNFNYQLTPSIILEIRKWERDTGRPCKILYTAHDYQLVCPNHMCNVPNTGENCEKCLTGEFKYCVKNHCIHGSKAKSLVGALEAIFWSRMKVYQKIDTVICCSSFMKEKLDKNAIFREKTVVLYNFIDSKQWQEREKKEYVLYFGRFSKEKGIQTLIEVCKSLPHISFIFAGTGPLEEQIQKVSNIHNVGFQKGEELERLVGEALFSVYPSEWYENCPFSVMESQMLGTPVLGADIGGIPELIQNKKTGELFICKDKEDLKKKIETLWNDRELLRKYSENCKECKFMDREGYYQRWLKLVQK